jgi:hypothetical protein
VLYSYLHSVALDANIVRFNGLERRQLHRGASANVEAGSVARALDLRIVELALIQRAAVMGAQIVDGVVLATQVAHRNFVVAHMKNGYSFGWDVGGFGHSLPCRHSDAE